MILMVVLVYSCSEEETISDSVHGRMVQDDTNPISTMKIDQDVIANNGIGHSCLDEAVVGSGSCILNTFSGAIALPQYPGCSFWIYAEYYVCTSNGSGQAIYFIDFEVLEHDCPQFNQDIINANNSNTLDQFTAHFNASVWKVLTYSLISGSPPNVSQIGFEYYSAACEKTCYVIVTKKGFTGYVPIDYPCSEYCCKVRRNFSFSSTTNQWEQTDVFYNVDNNNPCWSDTPPQNCPPNTVFTIDCRSNCESLLW